VLKLKAEAAPYADRLLRMDDLLPYQATADASGDSPAKERDSDVERPFEYARKNALSTFTMSRWILAYKRWKAEASGEPSSSKATEDADAGDGQEGE
jgi:hypothetical protein